MVVLSHEGPGELFVRVLTRVAIVIFSHCFYMTPADADRHAKFGQY